MLNIGDKVKYNREAIKHYGKRLAKYRYVIKEIRRGSIAYFEDGKGADSLVYLELDRLPTPFERRVQRYINKEFKELRITR